MIIAVQPDDYGPGDASSPIWTRLLREAGHEVRQVDVYRADILEQLEGCHGFMWRHAHWPHMRQVAKRLLPVLEWELGLAVYPDQNTCWHYDDKIVQAYLFEALQIPAPKTWVWFERGQALAFARSAGYPLVLKLWAGAGSRNVALVRSQNEAVGWVKRFFGRGVVSLTPRWSSVTAFLKEMAVIALRRKRPPPLGELHKNYVLFQEFLPDNPYDTRVTVIGNRAFGFRRFNRDGDFRASGSGKIDYDPKGVSPEFVRLAFDTARKLRAQSCAIDGLWRAGEATVGEVSYTYVSRAVWACPGHWDEDLNWHTGQMWPEEAQVHDFLWRLESR